MTPRGRCAERVQAANRKIPVNEAELGFVMAHEIGHLMLPGSSQTDTGPMKNHWHVRDLQRLNLLTLDFSAEQADQIRRTLENASHDELRARSTLNRSTWAEGGPFS